MEQSIHLRATQAVVDRLEAQIGRDRTAMHIAIDTYATTQANLAVAQSRLKALQEAAKQDSARRGVGS